MPPPFRDVIVETRVQASEYPWWLKFEDDGPVGCPSAVSRPLTWLLSQHNDDGSWGNGPAELEGRPLGTTGITALAVLPLLGGGYTPVVNDRCIIDGGDWSFGAELRKGLKWLIGDQREDGTFRSSADGTFDQALGAFALSEAYGATATATLKPPAQRAVDALIRMQKADGGWDGAGPTAWALVALHSARASELVVEPAALDRGLRSEGYPGYPGHALARILLRKDADHVASLLREESRERTTSNLAWWYLASLALWAHDGSPEGRPLGFNPGPRWNAWSPTVHQRLVPLLREDGSVEGRTLNDSIVRTSVTQLTLEVYYHYNCVFRPH
jgi:hypothetical protein